MYSNALQLTTKSWNNKTVGNQTEHKYTGKIVVVWPRWPKAIHKHYFWHHSLSTLFIDFRCRNEIILFKVFGNKPGAAVSFSVCYCSPSVLSRVIQYGGIPLPHNRNFDYICVPFQFTPLAKTMCAKMHCLSHNDHVWHFRKCFHKAIIFKRKETQYCAPLNTLHTVKFSH